MAGSFSLRALEAFEVAARRGSFVLAAEELGISPSAVSQLIRMLEEQSGRRLFERVKRGIQLSEAGRDAFPRLQAAFYDIRETSEELRRSVGPSRLVISVPPSIASVWLPKKLGEFVEQYPNVGLRIREDHDPVDLEEQRIDIRLSYGPFPQPAAKIVANLQDHCVAVCAPSYLDNFVGTKHLKHDTDCRLITTDWGGDAARFPTWSDFFGQEHTNVGHTVSSSQSAVSLARCGMGIALVQVLFVSQYLRENHLILADQKKLTMDQPYCLSIRNVSLQRPIVKQFARHFEAIINKAVASPIPM
ncbi:LysR family transcriptional regulator [Cochlodiniinecator piscidefendens]|uniref:LysR family transcriptional regulator n=1 Tax=Cochlodiniinecator piscidefendens TaxID=2715756 RepID=UPI00140B8C7B|nr:LysR family transcriptional regulator [Cochlodiniinecator piscidefendens]